MGSRGGGDGMDKDNGRKRRRMRKKIIVCTRAGRQTDRQTDAAYAETATVYERRRNEKTKMATRLKPVHNLELPRRR